MTQLLVNGFEQKKATGMKLLDGYKELFFVKVDLSRRLDNLGKQGVVSQYKDQHKTIHLPNQPEQCYLQDVQDFLLLERQNKIKEWREKFDGQQTITCTLTTNRPRSSKYTCANPPLQ